MGEAPSAKLSGTVLDADVFSMAMVRADCGLHVFGILHGQMSMWTFLMIKIVIHFNFYLKIFKVVLKNKNNKKLVA